MVASVSDVFWAKQKEREISMNSSPDRQTDRQIDRKIPIILALEEERHLKREKNTD